MLKDLKVQVYLVSIEKIDIVNERTGEITELMKLEYVMPSEPTDKRVGGYVLEGYSNRKHYNLIKDKVNTVVSAEINQQIKKNGVKYRFTKIDTVEL